MFHGSNEPQNRFADSRLCLLTAFGSVGAGCNAVPYRSVASASVFYSKTRWLSLRLPPNEVAFCSHLLRFKGRWWTLERPLTAQISRCCLIRATHVIRASHSDHEACIGRLWQLQQQQQQVRHPIRSDDITHKAGDLL